MESDLKSIKKKIFFYRYDGITIGFEGFKSDLKSDTYHYLITFYYANILQNERSRETFISFMI